MTVEGGRGPRTGDGAARPGAAPLGDLAPALLWAATGDGHLLTANATWLAFTGLTFEQAAGTGWTTPVHPDDKPRRHAAFSRAAAAGEPFEVEFRLRHRDGSWRWIIERAVPVGPRDDLGPEFTFAGAALDITRRRGEELDLLHSRDDLRLALAAGNMGTWVWDRRTNAVFRDRHLQLLYGLDPEAATGSFEEWVDLVHPEDRETLLRDVERAVTEGRTYQLEHRVVRPDGTVRWLARSGAAYYDDDGEVAGTRGVVVDITARKQAEEEHKLLLAAEREARRQAELAAGRLARLQAVTAGLSDARTPEEVAEVIVTQGTQSLEASSGALYLLDRSSDELVLIRQEGYPAKIIEQFRSFSRDDPLPASDALRTGKVVLLHSIGDRDERYPILRGIVSANVSTAVIPLVTGDRPLGTISLGWRQPRAFDDMDVAFLTALGQQASQAVDRAQYHQAEHARAQRQGLLAEASRLLGSSLDYEGALRQIARLSVPTVSDAFSAHLLEDGDLRAVAVAVAGTDAGPGEVGGESQERAEVEPDTPAAGTAWCFGRDQLLEVATGERSRLVRHGTDERRTRGGGDHPAVAEESGCRSALAVPLRSHDEALGVLVVAMASSGRRLEPSDVEFVEDMAARAAAAIANSRSHQARTTVARTLQHSLLPPEVPILPGLEIAARYRPLGDDVQVGGDFYDVFAAAGGRWGVVIGDVSGKGVPAASLTALARYTVRTASRDVAEPSKVLGVLNNSIIDDGAGERFCTVALAFLRYDAAGVHFTVSCGGQPLPFLVERSGEVRQVGRPGTAIGLFGEPKLTDVSTTLGPEELLVLYTDGVVEARSPSGEFDDGLLEATLRTCAGQPAESVADAIEQALNEFAGGRPRDDTAILVIRRPPGMFHEHFVPGPRTVPRCRQRLREWLGDHLTVAPGLADDVLLIANELATNAERAADAAVDVQVSIDPDKVTIDVSDDGTGFGGRFLSLATPAADAVGGRGMAIVSGLADQCIVRSGSCGTLFRCIVYRPQGSLEPPR